MSAKHTPGPWEVERARNRLPYRITAPNGDDQKPGAVGKHITRWGAISLPSSEEGKANARLIAAAPELLEMLERCEMWLSTAPDGRAMQRACQAVITKATGKEEA